MGLVVGAVLAGGGGDVVVVVVVVCIEGQSMRLSVTGKEKMKEKMKVVRKVVRVVVNSKAARENQEHRTAKQSQANPTLTT